jgi:hypothetical protein
VYNDFRYFFSCLADPAVGDIYKWIAFEQTIKCFKDYSEFDKFLHIMTNTFVVNPVRPDENEDSKPRKREHILLFASSILDAAF